MLRRAVSAVCMVLVLSCGIERPASPNGHLSEPASKKGNRSGKTSVCHLDDEGIFRPISVSENALPAHLAHGDEIAGDGVLDEECRPLPADELTVELPGGVTMDFLWIEPGTFIMGSPASDPDALSRERPQHEVTITQGFWLAKYEITQAQWHAVMGSEPWSGKGHVQSGATYPAVFVSWTDTQELVRTLNTMAGADVYRLPTEAEWEYACRAGTTTRWSFGDEASEIGEYAWYEGNAFGVGLEFAQPVGTKLPNPWGLHDMHGNVWEWVQDWYGTWYSTEPQTDPTGPTTGVDHLVRGGNAGAGPPSHRSAFRMNVKTNHRIDSVGTRLVRTE